MRKGVFNMSEQVRNKVACTVSHRRRLQAWNFGFKEKELTLIFVNIAKTKTLISCAITVQQICVFVFAYAKENCFLVA